MPNSLFKYFGPEKLAHFVAGGVLLTPANYLNDPFEFAISRGKLKPREINTLFDRFVREAYQNYSRETDAPLSFEAFSSEQESQREAYVTQMLSEESLEREPQCMQDGLSKFHGIVCLSEIPDNLQMWGHYTESFKGFVAEFETSSDFATSNLVWRKTPFGPAAKVDYTLQKPLLLPDFSNSTQLYCMKPIAWEHEREWRVIAPLKSASRQNEKGFYFLHFAVSWLRRVIVGHRMSEQDISRLRALAQSSNHISFQSAFPIAHEHVVAFRDLCAA